MGFQIFSFLWTKLVQAAKHSHSRCHFTSFTFSLFFSFSFSCWFRKFIRYSGDSIQIVFQWLFLCSFPCSSLLLLLAFGFGHLVARFYCIFQVDEPQETPHSPQSALPALSIHLFDLVVCGIQYDFWGYALLLLWHLLMLPTPLCETAAAAAPQLME